MSKISNNNSAFTLPEMLLTAFILSYALSMVLASYVNCMSLNQSSRSLVSAVSHIEFVMEDMRNSAFASIAANISSGNWNWNGATVTSRGLTALNNESITTTYTGTNPLDITVTVSWNEIKGGSHSRTLRTTISG